MKRERSVRVTIPKSMKSVRKEVARGTPHQTLPFVSPPGQQSKAHAEAAVWAISQETSAPLPHREVPEPSIPFCLLSSCPGFHPPSKPSGQQSLPASSLALEPDSSVQLLAQAVSCTPVCQVTSHSWPQGSPHRLRAQLSQSCTRCLPASRVSDENTIDT